LGIDVVAQDSHRSDVAQYEDILCTSPQFISDPPGPRQTYSSSILPVFATMLPIWVPPRPSQWRGYKYWWASREWRTNATTENVQKPDCTNM